MTKHSAQTNLTRAIVDGYGGSTDFACRVLASQIVHEMPMYDLNALFDFEQTTRTDQNGVELFRIVATLKPANQDRFNAVKYEPEVPTHPGATLADKIDEMQISTTTFSERSGLSVKMLWDLMHGKESITEEIAEALELVTSIPARHWIARQARYDQYVAKVEEAAKQGTQQPNK